MTNDIVPIDPERAREQRADAALIESRWDALHPITCHEVDDDSICVHCGFDSAEWWHLERMKEPENREPQPICSAFSPEGEV